MKYINLFNTETEYDNAEKQYPNSSYIVDIDQMRYVETESDPTLIVTKFTTTSANQQIKISNKQENFSSIVADGEPLTIGTGALNHTFASAGEHEVEYRALDTTLIPNDAFNGCRYLVSATIPKSVTSIGNGAFSSCSDLTAITIPNSVTTIGNGAFYGCSGLTSVTIGNSVTSIGINAFVFCSGLTSVTIPNSVTEIGGSAFARCTGLTSIVVKNGNPKYDSRDNCNAIIETATNSLIAGCKNTVIPNSVTEIGSNAFARCTDLTEVIIGNSVTEIGNSAFNGCTGLISVTIGNSVTSIGSNAFSSCTDLTSMTIGNSVTTIGQDAFNDCTSLTSIVVKNGNPKYDSRDNCNAIIETETNILIYGCKNSVIPNSVTTIGNYAFSGCTGLTSVTIPNSVTTIGGSAFSGCTGLISVTIGNSVTSIGEGAFSSCTDLTEVIIGNSVTEIGDSAFNGCTVLTSITSLATTPPTIQYSTFDEVPDDCPIYVPDESVYEYSDAEGWSERAAYIQAIP